MSRISVGGSGSDSFEDVEDVGELVRDLRLRRR